MLSDRQRIAAHTAIAQAQATRERLRRRYRKGGAGRRADIERELASLKHAMQPINSALHRTQFQPEHPDRFDLLNLSFLIQRERRKLWKLKQPRLHQDR